MQAHFVAAAGLGQLHTVAEYLDDSYDIDSKFHDRLSPVDLAGEPAPHPPQGQTALIKVCALTRRRCRMCICAFDIRH